MSNRFDFIEITDDTASPVPSARPAVPRPAATPAPMRLDVVEIIGGPGTALGQFARPCGLCVGREGSIFVADTGNHRVQKITTSGDVIGLGGHGSDAGLFQFPVSVAVDNLGGLFVLSHANCVIHKFGPDGRLHHAFGSRGAQVFQMDSPMAIALDYFNNVFVVDADTGRIPVYSPLGRFERLFADTSTLSSPLSRPQGLCITEGAVYVADSENGRVIRFDSSGKAEYTVGSAVGSRVGELNYPVSVSVDAKDNLYVVEAGNHRLQLFPSDDEPRILFDRLSHPHVQLNNPRGIAIAEDGSLYVCDTDNHRVVRFAML